MRIRNTSRVMFIAPMLLFVLSACHSACGDEALPFSRRLPDSVAAHLTIPDAGDVRERLPKSSWGRLLNDPQMSEFRNDLTDQLRAFIGASIQIPEDVPVDDLLRLDVGEVTLTVLKPVDGNLPVVFTVETGSAGRTVDTLVQSSIRDSLRQGWQRSSINHADSIVTILKHDATETRPEEVLVILQRDGYLVVSNSVDSLKQILDRWSGTVQGSFAENATLDRVQRVVIQPDRQPALFWYLDPVGSAVSLLSHGAATNPTTATALSRLPKLGLTSFRGVGGTVDFATGDHDTVTRMAGVVDQPASAAVALVQFPATELTPPVWIPNDVDSFLMANWDAQTAYAGAEQMADEFLGPGGLAKALDVLSTKTNPPIHLKKDVIDGMTGQVMIIQSRPARQPKQKRATLLAIPLKTPPDFERIIRQLIDQPGSKAGSRTIDRTTVAVFDGKQSSTHLTVAHGALLISNSAPLLDSIVSPSTSDPLIESADYRRLTASIPMKKSLLSIQRPVNQLQSIYDILKQGGVAVPGGLDLKLLPPFDRIQHHFLPTATWAAPTSDGFQYVSFSLPPQE